MQGSVAGADAVLSHDALSLVELPVSHRANFIDRTQPIVGKDSKVIEIDNAVPVEVFAQKDLGRQPAIRKSRKVPELDGVIRIQISSVTCIGQ